MRNMSITVLLLNVACCFWMLSTGNNFIAGMNFAAVLDNLMYLFLISQGVNNE